MKVLLVHPGSGHSTADVEAGLRAGLEALGVQVIRYRLDGRIKAAEASLATAYKRAAKKNPDLVRPTWADVVYQASIGTLERALRFEVDCVLVVSAILFHPDAAVLLRRAGLPVAVILTESPYDLEPELALARLVDFVWTNELSCLPAFRAVHPEAGYLPAAYHPDVHKIGPVDSSVPAHDVVFVGSGFPSRIDFLSAINWTGVNLGLYGTWQNVVSTKRHPLKRFVREGVIDNAKATALYRRASIGLNLYRGGVLDRGRVVLASAGESLNPRAYELAATGVFCLSEWRAEYRDRFGSLDDTFTTPAEAENLIRHWLPREVERQRRAAELPGLVAGHSWRDRAEHVVKDIDRLLRRRQAA